MELLDFEQCLSSLSPLVAALIEPHRASVLDSVLFRVGILASLRSKKLDGQVIGVMVTASHNPAKVCDSVLVTKKQKLNSILGQWSQIG